MAQLRGPTKPVTLTINLDRRVNVLLFVEIDVARGWRMKS